MGAHEVIGNVLGTIGTVCWTIQMIPQIWKSYRSKSTDGLSDWMIFVRGVSGPLLGIYAVLEGQNVPSNLQPQIFAFFCAVSWTQCLFYGREWPLKQCVAHCAIFITLMAGFEVGMIYAVKPSISKGDIAPFRVFSTASSAVIALSFIPQYWEIYERREVTGISMTFMTVDIGGGVFSIISLAFKKKFDIFMSITYLVVIVMDAVIVIAALVLNIIVRRKRAARASEFAHVVGASTAPTDGAGSSNLQRNPPSDEATWRSSGWVELATLTATWSPW